MASVSLRSTRPKVAPKSKKGAAKPPRDEILQRVESEGDEVEAAAPSHASTQASNASCVDRSQASPRTSLLGSSQRTIEIERFGKAASIDFSIDQRAHARSTQTCSRRAYRSR